MRSGMSWHAAGADLVRRLTLCFLALLLFLPCAGRAEHTYESQLLACPLIEQFDSRYQGKNYRYMNAAFSAEGCGPSSVANLLASVLGVEDQTDMDGLLSEILWMLPYNHVPSTTEADLRNMDRLGRISEEETPVLYRMTQRFGGHWTVIGEEAAPEELARLAADSVTPSFYAARFRLSERWGELTQLCSALYGAGLEEAVIGVGHLSVGNRNVDAPFRYRDGHYVSLCIHVKTLMEEGSLYLLDSYPRALAGEKVGRGAYSDYYVLKVAPGETLNASFVLTRIKPEVVRIRLNTDVRGIIRGTGMEERSGVMAEYLEKIKLFGSGMICVMIP